MLNILEFNSTRKRMSIVIRTPDNRIILYCKVWRARMCIASCTPLFAYAQLARARAWCSTPACPPAEPRGVATRPRTPPLPQGADTVIYERLDKGHPLNGSLRDVTLSHMEEFGSAGLRTLCLAYKELDPTVYDE